MLEILFFYRCREILIKFYDYASESFKKKTEKWGKWASLWKPGIAAQNDTETVFEMFQSVAKCWINVEVSLFILDKMCRCSTTISLTMSASLNEPITSSQCCYQLLSVFTGRHRGHGKYGPDVDKCTAPLPKHCRVMWRSESFWSCFTTHELDILI